MSECIEARTRLIKKPRRSDCAMSKDLISNLPDDVVSHILSFLPIQDIFETRMLSKDWEFKWKLTYGLNISDEYIFHKEWKDVVKFVERMFHQFQNLKRFHVSCTCYQNDEFHGLITWVSYLLKHNIESLEITASFWYARNYEHEDIILPSTLLSCESLNNLAVEMPCTLNIGVSNCFPRLTRLHLKRVMIVNECSSTDTMVLTFPVLKYCELYVCEWLKVKFVEINAPALITFKSLVSYMCNASKADTYSIKITGSRLEKFKASGGYVENVVLDGSRVIYADLGEFIDGYKCALQIRKLLQELQHLKHLNLLGIWTDFARTKLVGPPFPMFLQLEKLYVTFTNGEGLLELLHAAPRLKFFEICLANMEAYDYDSVESVPSCLELHLVEVKFDCDWMTGFGLPKFLLKNGLRLTKVSICGCLEFSKDELFKELSTFPKGSTFLTIEKH